MFPRFARRHGSGNQCRQLPRAGDRRLPARLRQHPGDPARETLFTQFAQHPFNLFPFRARQPLGRAHARLRVHAHIQGTVLPEPEPPGGLVQLGRRHPQVQEHPLDTARQPLLFQHIAHVRE